MPTADFLVSGPGRPGLLIDPAVVLDRGCAVPGHHPRHDRLRALIVAGVGGGQRRQNAGVNVDLMRCHARNRSRSRRPATSTATRNSELTGARDEWIELRPDHTPPDLHALFDERPQGADVCDPLVTGVAGGWWLRTLDHRGGCARCPASPTRPG